MKTGLERIGGITLIVLIAAIAYAIHILIKAGTTAGNDGKPAIEHGTTGDVPVSVLRYPECTEQDEAEGNCALRETVPCYTGEKIKKFLNEKNAEAPHSLILTGATNNENRMEFYESDEEGGPFFILSIGTDKTGEKEACLIAAGKGLAWGPPLPNESAEPVTDMASELDAEE